MPRSSPMRMHSPTANALASPPVQSPHIQWAALTSMTSPNANMALQPQCTAPLPKRYFNPPAQLKKRRCGALALMLSPTADAVHHKLWRKCHACVDRCHASTLRNIYKAGPACPPARPAGLVVPRVGPKAPNMQEYDPLPPYATPFTRVPLLCTRGSKELRPVVCRHQTLSAPCRHCLLDAVNHGRHCRHVVDAK